MTQREANTGPVPHSARVEERVEAPAEAVYDLVSDITRMGEWSPECYRCEWVDDTNDAVPGGRFRGWNRFLKVLRWSRVCEVLVAERGRRFEFRTVPKGVFRDSTRWTFEFHPDDQGTRVVQRYMLEKPSRPVLLFDRISGHPAALEAGMRETLARVKAAAEATAVGR